MLSLTQGETRNILVELTITHRERGRGTHSIIIEIDNWMDRMERERQLIGIF